ncbi:hypothetical protein T439DRAFT_335504 [Meredithblackwellia eburnea MCA 4105]
MWHAFSHDPAYFRRTINKLPENLRKDFRDFLVFDPMFKDKEETIEPRLRALATMKEFGLQGSDYIWRPFAPPANGESQPDKSKEVQQRLVTKFSEDPVVCICLTIFQIYGQLLNHLLVPTVSSLMMRKNTYRCQAYKISQSKGQLRIPVIRKRRQTKKLKVIGFYGLSHLLTHSTSWMLTGTYLPPLKDKDYATVQSLGSRHYALVTPRQHRRLRAALSNARACRY